MHRNSYRDYLAKYFPMGAKAEPDPYTVVAGPGDPVIDRSTGISALMQSLQNGLWARMSGAPNRADWMPIDLSQYRAVQAESDLKGLFGGGEVPQVLDTLGYIQAPRHGPRPSGPQPAPTPGTGQPQGTPTPYDIRNGRR